MRIALDATYALDPQPTGVALYSQRVIAALGAALANSGLDITVAARARRFPALCRAYPSSRFRRCLLQEPFNLLLPRQADVFHGLNQRLPRYRFARQVVTIHDVFVLSSTRYSGQEFRGRFAALLRDAVSRADALITVSGYTRDQLCRYLDVDPARVAVVHHGIDQVTHFERRPAGFLLTVGSVQVRKNTLGAVKALELLPKTVRLVVAGGAGYGAEEVFAYVRDHGLGERVQFIGHAAEAALDKLYAEAAALLFPSFDEGFGFPVLEAMARGLPVVAARAGALPEICGDAALLVDPEDIEGLAKSCRRVIEDQTLALDLGVRGREQAAKFTWEKAAKETLRVYGGNCDPQI